MLTKKEIKQRHFDKVYKEAPIIECACGCGTKIKTKDKYARDVKYVSGHNGRKYENATQFKREWNKRNKDARYKYKEEYQRKRKGRLIKMLGGKCIKCDTKYDGKNGAMFQFHHRNPEEKEMTLGLSKMGLAWKRIIKESKKCDLMCANCHSLEHGSEY